MPDACPQFIVVSTQGNVRTAVLRTNDETEAREHAATLRRRGVTVNVLCVRSVDEIETIEDDDVPSV